MEINVKTNGLKITAKGDLEEIKNLIISLKGMEEKREYKKNLARVTGISVTDELIKIIQKGFFNKPKTFRDISNNLEMKGIKVVSTTLHPVLSRLIVKNKLKRSKNKEGLWEYEHKKK